ncbi:MAG: coniferyl-alcohol dehydrogenase [Burkholderiales bacterium]
MPELRVAITGSATGIGAETARILKLRGAHITAFDIIEPSANADRFIRVDLADPASIDAAAAVVEGPFDALLNIAGVPPRPGREANVLAVNWIGMRRFARAMVDKLASGASIVNMGSRAGGRWSENIEQVKACLALPDDADAAAFCRDHVIDATRAYNLSKEAVIVWTMMQTVALIPRALRVNSISPGAVATGILDDFIAAFGEQTTRYFARVGRPGKPEEIAEVAAFLASPQSGWIKGVDLVVEGGMLACLTSEALGLSPSPSA